MAARYYGIKGVCEIRDVSELSELSHWVRLMLTFRGREVDVGRVESDELSNEWIRKKCSSKWSRRAISTFNVDVEVR